MKTSQIFNAAYLLRVAIETEEGVPAVLSNQAYLPLSSVAETSDNPITLDPIATSPTQRAFVSYQTDSGRGATAKGYLFSALNFIGRQIALRTASTFIMVGGDSTFDITDTETITLAGVTATAKNTDTGLVLWDFAEPYYDYVTNGVASSTNFDFTGTMDENFNVFIEDPASSADYMFFVAKDPLYTGALPTIGGTMGLTFDENTSTGTGIQLNLPELYPVFVAAGMAPTFGMTLGLPDSIDTLWQQGYDFHDKQNAQRDSALALISTMKNIIASMRRLPIGATGIAALDTLKNDLVAIEVKVIRSYASTVNLLTNLLLGRNNFATNLAQGKYRSATEAVQSYAGECDGLGHVEIITGLREGKSVTINGRTWVNDTLGRKATALEVANAFRSNTGLTGTIASGYSFGTRLDREKILVSKTGSLAGWDVIWSSTDINFKVTICPPLVNVFETSAARSGIVDDLADLSNENPVVKASFEALQVELEKVWSNLSTVLATKDNLYTNAAATGALLDDLDALSTDDTFLPNKLTYAYTRMTVSDTGIAALDRITGELTQFNERGTTKKVSLFNNALVTSLDLSIKANEPPMLNFTFAGNPGEVTVAEGNVVGFSAARLKTMPQMSGENVTFCSLVKEGDSFVNRNILLQELSLPNMAGLKADREVLATEAHHKVSTDSVGRKATLTIIDGDTSDTVGGLPFDYKELLNQSMYFRLQCGNLQGLTYFVNLNGVLTNESGGASQANSSERMLEITVKNFSLVLQ